MLDQGTAADELPALPTGAAAALVLDLLEWLVPRPRPYAEVMEAWRTSCPRLSVWEDAVDGGFLARRQAGPGEVLVELTPLGRQYLERAGRCRHA